MVTLHTALHVTIITQARVHCLICTHNAQGRVRTYPAMHEYLCCNYVIHYTSGTLKICLNLLLTALPIYITRDSNFDYGISFYHFRDVYLNNKSYYYYYYYLFIVYLNNKSYYYYYYLFTRHWRAYTRG